MRQRIADVEAEMETERKRRQLEMVARTGPR
jgi:hypothetical protein